jgi:hypothetical protein
VVDSAARKATASNWNCSHSGHPTRVGAVRAALVDEDDFAVGVESVLDHERHFEEPRRRGRPKVHDRIGFGVVRRRVRA